MTDNPDQPKIHWHAGVLCDSGAMLTVESYASMYAGGSFTEVTTLGAPVADDFRTLVPPGEQFDRLRNAVDDLLPLLVAQRVVTDRHQLAAGLLVLAIEALSARSIEDWPGDDLAIAEVCS